MFSTAEKTSHSTTPVREKAGDTAFFRKAGEDSFFGAKEASSFFGVAQPKLNVSSPDDPQEKEADAVADQVMRMQEQVNIQPSSAEEQVERKEEEDKLVQASTETPQLQHRSAAEEEEKIHSKGMSSIHRYADAGSEEKKEGACTGDCKGSLQAKNNKTGEELPLQLKGRGPPKISDTFSQKLSASKGAGSPMPEQSRQFMESRFNADFSKVRVHTGPAAQDLSQAINAQAFASGRDIYFNSGRFSPDTATGRRLLAHELTHTIQQGAVNTAVPDFSPEEQQLHLKEAEGQKEKEEELQASDIHPFVQKKGSNGREMASQVSAEPLSIQASWQGSHPFVRKETYPSAWSQATISRQIQQKVRGPPVFTQSGGMGVHRSVLDDALKHASSLTDCIGVFPAEVKACLKGKAQQVALQIPGYRALRVVLAKDPITGDEVDRNGRNFLNAALEIMPAGSLLREKLVELEQLDTAAAWIDRQLGEMEDILSNVSGRIDAYIESLDESDLFSPREALRDGVNIILSFIDKVIGFAKKVAAELLETIKEFLLGKIVKFIKEQTDAYPLLTVILGKDPVTEETVEPNGTNILHAILELNGEKGRQQRTQMQETGTFQRVAAYIDEGIKTFSGAYENVVQGFKTIWEEVSIESLMDPAETFRKIYKVFAAPLSRVWEFVKEVGSVILNYIKEALMSRLSADARRVRGYQLITILIERDPFTNRRVPRTIPNIVRGFMSLMEGGEEQYRQMEETGAIARASQQIEAAVEKLNMTPAYIIQLFSSLWGSFSLNDLANPMEAFQRIIDRFGQPIGRLVVFVAEIVRIVVRVILKIMNFPLELINGIISRAMAAFGQIKRDPVGFLINLLRALKQGFVQFFDNMATHLMSGLTGWLMSELKEADVPAPQDFSLKGIIGWVTEVLNISIEAIWQKLAEHPRIGPEKVARIRGMIDKLEGIWTFIKDVQERGMAAIWERIQEQLSNLWDTILDAVRNWVMENIINKVTKKILSMLDPTGIMAVVNSAIAIYKAIQSFARYMREMLEVVNTFVHGVADIAAGNVAAAASFLEGAMSRAMPIVIGFLANQVGLSGIGKKIANIIQSAGESVDRALSWLINKAVNTGMGLLEKGMVMGRKAVSAVASWFKKKAPVKMRNGEQHTIYLEENDHGFRLMIRSAPKTYLEFITRELKRNGMYPAASGSVENRAIEKAEEVDEKLSAYGAVEQRDRVSWGVKLAELMDELAFLTSQMKINMHVPDPPSIIRYGSPNKEGFATRMTAELLSKNNVKGEPAGSDSKAVLGWDYVRSFKRIAKSGNPSFIYVKGHLLNQKLGGLANVTNLTPITSSMNSEHLNKVEKHVKKLILGKKNRKDKTGVKHAVNYTVEVDYAGHSGRSRLMNEYHGKMAEAKEKYLKEKGKASPDPEKIASLEKSYQAAKEIVALLWMEGSSLSTAFKCSWSRMIFDVQTEKWRAIKAEDEKKKGYDAVENESGSVEIPHDLPERVEFYKPYFTTFQTNIEQP